jgi:amino acid adenylation domain-containing protein
MKIDDDDRGQDLFEASNLTHSQFLIWLGQKLSPDAPLYNMAFTFTISGNLNPRAFRSAFQKLVDESDALRTVIVEVDGVPLQRVLPRLDYKVQLLDFRSKKDPEEACATWSAHRCQLKLQLQERLFESVLIRISDEMTVWYMNQHHLAVDAWSSTVLYRRMSEYYPLAVSGDFSNVTSLPAYQAYRDHEQRHRDSTTYQKAFNFWQKKLETPVDNPLFYGRQLSENSTRTQRVYCELGVERSQQLRRIALEDGVRSLTTDITLFNIFAALLFTWMHRATGNRNLSVGTFAHNRVNKQFKSTAGMFIEIFPLFATVDDDETFSSLMGRLGKETLGFVVNAQPGVGDATAKHSYHAILNFINASFGDFAGLPMTSRWVHPGHGDRSHALRLQVHDFDGTGNYQLLFDFNIEAFDEELRGFATQHFMHIVDAFIEDRNIALCDIDLLGEENRRHIVTELNSIASNDLPESTVLQLFERQAARHVDRIAVDARNKRFTYRDLNERASRLAQQLAELGLGQSRIAAIVCERSVDFLVAILGVMKTGAAYVPIEPTYPAARIAQIMHDTGATIVLTQSTLRTEFPESCSIICIDDDDGEVSALPQSTPLRAPGPEDRAYLIYTSGSTGTPKGVVIQHRALSNYITWARKQYVGKASCDMPFFSTISADLTVTSIFLPLVCGGTVVVYGEEADSPDLSILKVIADDKVDVLKLTPSHLALVKDQITPESRLETIIVGGEDFKTVLARQVLDILPPGLKIYNEYGPTEATVGCMIHRFDPEKDIAASVPIGNPVDNMQIYVLDSDGDPVPFGFAGEIFVAGPGLAEGYLNQQALTDERFVDNPYKPGSKMYGTGDLARWRADGILEFRGRSDDQVKIKGFRVEPAEIEAALLAHPTIIDGVVNVINHNAVGNVQLSNCRTCGLASNHPDARIDESGVCQICKDFEQQSNDAHLYLKNTDDLEEVFADVKALRDNQYDCVMLLSGGKDSTYALYQIVNMGLTPLVFSLDNGYISDQAKTNIKTVVEDLDLDLVWGSTPAMNEIFVDSLKRFSNVCNGCHKVIYTLSINLALEHGIRHVVTGLSRGQFFETRVSQFYNNKIFAISEIDHSISEARKAYHRMNDAVSRNLDVSAFQDDEVFERVQFIDYYRYTDISLDQMMEFLDTKTAWVRPTDTGRSTNCLINEAGIYVHQRERGFHNYALPYSWDVRLGHKKRDEALAELDDDIVVSNAQHILKEIGYQESTQPVDSKRLAAYYTADADIPASDLRAFLSRTLPPFMVPSTFVRLDEMPLSTSGKVDRSALPLPGEERMNMDSAYLAPRDENEEHLVAIWESVMRIRPIGVDDNFFDLGGDSISNIQIVARANRDGLNLTCAQVFNNPTISALATLADFRARAANSDAGEEGPGRAAEDTGASTLPLADLQRFAGGEEPYSLSPLQSGILFHSLSAPDSGVYVEQYYCTLQGAVDEQLLQEAWRQIVARHGALRTAIVWQDRDEPVQIEIDIVQLHWDIQDWRQTEKPGQQSQFQDWLQADSRAGFNLSQAPLTRFALIRLDEKTWQFVWSFHHIILDGWSSQIVLEDVFNTYERLSRADVSSHPPVTSFRHYVDVLRQQDKSESTRYWLKVLKGFAEPTCPRDLDANAEADPAIEKIVCPLSDNLNTAIRTLARDNRLTMNTLIQGAWAVVLGNYTRCSDVVFGSTVSGRQVALEGVDRMTGLFINTLPVRASLPSSKPILTWLSELQDQQIAMRRFESSSLVDIQKCSEIPVGESLFDTLVVFENHSLLAELNERLGFTTSDVNYRDRSNFPLAILAIQDVGLDLAFLYAGNRFTATFISQLAECFIAVLQAFTEHPRMPLGTLPTLSAAQFESYVVERNQTARDFPADVSIHRLVEIRAAEHPEAIAIISCEASLTYEELNGKANQLAQELRRLGVRQGACVGLHLDRSVEMIIGMLAVLKSGGGYVPLDPDYPPGRLEFMIEDASILVLLTRSSVSPQIPFAATKTIVMDTAWEEMAGHSVSDPGWPVDSGDLAYIIYTSGSSGTPKGVMVSHRNVVSSTMARVSYYSPVVRFLLLSSISFDSSVAGIYWTLCEGGCLHLPNPQRFTETDYLAGLIREQSITHLLCIPSFWQILLEEDGLSSLSAVIVAGEACPSTLPQQHFRALPESSLYNEYGPTEATVWSTVFDCSSAHAPKSVPIGLPIDNVTAFVLDDRMRPLPVGVPGELYIGGEGVAMGYLNLPEATADRFIDPPPALPVQGRLYRTGDSVRYQSDGYLEFLGRVDRQIKMRGHRIEVGEIEAVLSQHPDVVEATVVIKDSQALVTNGTGPETDNLNEQLRGMGTEAAQVLLAEVESASNSDPDSAKIETIETPDFRIDLTLKKLDFINPPRETQRKWLLHQLLGDVRDDLNYLDAESKTFVTGRGTHLDALDESPQTWSEDQIMEDWQTPLMLAMAKHVTQGHGDVLEIGYGRGVSASFIQQGGVKSHTVIEANPACIETYFKPWQLANKDRDIRLKAGMWQDVLEDLGTYDGIFFHTFPMDEEEFINYVLDSATFAEHFFAEAARLLRPGGVFTYLTTEIGSLSRRHQRALFEHFSSITLSVQPVTVPEDTGDTWWAKSMVVIKAVK